jgi:hypothetical protein
MIDSRGRISEETHETATQWAELLESIRRRIDAIDEQMRIAAAKLAASPEQSQRPPA